MTSFRKLAPILAHGLLAWGALGSVAAWCGDMGSVSAPRCRQFGTGYVDLGNGVCERVSGHIGGQVRVQLGAAGQTGWGSAASTSQAAIRSYDGAGIPGTVATTTEHLRVRSSGIEPLGSFR